MIRRLHLTRSTIGCWLRKALWAMSCTEYDRANNGTCGCDFC